MSITIITPWGETIELDPPQPDLGLRVFAWLHFSAGHHYTVEMADGRLTGVRCGCGETCP